MNDYQKEQLQEKLKIVDDLNKFSYQWEFIPDKDEPWYGVIKLKGCEFGIGMNYQEYTKKYSFYLTEKLPYIEFYTQENIFKTIKKPQEVGVLTEKKITDWVDYLTKGYYELKQLSDTRVKSVAEFLAKMEQLGATINNDYRDKKSGSIVKNGLEFSFEIGDSGYISKKIEVYYSTDRSEDTFLKLADNKYQA